MWSPPPAWATKMPACGKLYYYESSATWARWWLRATKEELLLVGEPVEMEEFRIAAPNYARLALQTGYGDANPFALVFADDERDWLVDALLDADRCFDTETWRRSA